MNADLTFIDNVKFNEQGLVPCVAQDYLTKDVLMLAWMNEESLKMTIESGYATYFSRSRQKLWKKGETSGHLQKVVSLHYDCDGDTVLPIVEQIGPACHTGNRTCFFSPDEPQTISKVNILLHDYYTIADRKIHPVEGSYTNYLFDKGIDKICKKVGEESTEVIVAAKNGINKDTSNEIADLLYHLMVLMVEEGVTWDEVFDNLIGRIGMKSEKVQKIMKNGETPRKVDDI